MKRTTLFVLLVCNTVSNALFGALDWGAAQNRGSRDAQYDRFLTPNSDSYSRDLAKNELYFFGVVSSYVGSAAADHLTGQHGALPISFDVQNVHLEPMMATSNAGSNTIEALLRISMQLADHRLRDLKVDDGASALFAIYNPNELSRNGNRVIHLALVGRMRALVVDVENKRSRTPVTEQFVQETPYNSQGFKEYQTEGDGGCTERYLSTASEPDAEVRRISNKKLDARNGAIGTAWFKKNYDVLSLFGCAADKTNQGFPRFDIHYECVEVCKGERFIVLGSEGVWHQTRSPETSKAVEQSITKIVANHYDNAQDIANDLVDRSVNISPHKGAHANATAIVIDLDASNAQHQHTIARGSVALSNRIYTHTRASERVTSREPIFDDTFWSSFTNMGLILLLLKAIMILD